MLEQIANVIRGLAADGVEKAKSGHPGMPLGCAEIGAVLYSEVLKHDPHCPQWPNRDRFVLSAGHGSMFLYALLHLTGYDLPLAELKRFRQLGSITPGHPEYGVTAGVETSTGPLGQGFANAVGMALGEAMLAARFNRPGHTVVDHYTYAIAGDGDLMEGISSEAASLAGHWGLGKLVVIYDSNNITIEGRTDLAFTESVSDRFKAYGWQVQEIDGHNIVAISAALAAAKEDAQRPSLIVARTRIGCKSLKEDSSAAHGAPLGEKEVAELKKCLGLPAESFYVPESVYSFYTDKCQEWAARRNHWEEAFAAWSAAYPELRRDWDTTQSAGIPTNLNDLVPAFPTGSAMASREASGKVMQALAGVMPALVGGSADLAPSNNTNLTGMGSVQKGSFAGRNLHFGVREHGMGAICNGLALHGGFKVFCSTFLSFADYMRPAIRMAALMRLPVIYVFTHDSFYVGEDGPTHQPVEQLESLRIIPQVTLLRPADAAETRAAWLWAVQNTSGPTVLALTRQKLPALTEGREMLGLSRGGYVLQSTTGIPELVLVATGSEVSLAVSVAAVLNGEGRRVAVVSMPSRRLFLAQDPAYKAEVLPNGVPRLAIEAGVSNGWRAIAGDMGDVHGVDRFGDSGPANDVAKELGFTTEAVVAHARRLLM